MDLTRRDFVRASAAGALILAGADAADAAETLPGAQLRALRAAVSGRVYAPGNPGYNAARLVYNRRFDGIRPPAVVRVRNVADVKAVVAWANRFDVALVARAGGNAYNGGSTSRRAVVVDVGGLDGFALKGNVATVGPGLRNLPLYAALAARGAGIGSGSCPNVAVGGLSLGGGMGLAGRALGLMVDEAVGYDIVTADGLRHSVSATRNPDLFWALRGGGGSFGIVTAVRLRTRSLPSAAWFFASFPAASRAEAFAAWEDLAPDAPAALTSICTLNPTRAAVFGQYLGSESALRRLVAPISRIGGVQFSAGTDSFLALQRRWAACADGASVAQCTDEPRVTFAASSVYFAKALNAAGHRAFIAAADTGATLVCDAYGGVINDVAPGATAFVHRTARFSVQIASFTSLGTARSNVARARAKIAPYGNGQAYQNYADLALKNPQAAYYGANLARLEQVKADVDPDRRFRTAQGIVA